MSTTSSPQTSSPEGAAPTSPRRWTTGRILGTVTAAVFLLVGSLLVLGGAGLAAMSTAFRGDDGLVTSSPATWTSQGYAVRSEAVRLGHGPMMSDMPRRMMGTVRVSVTGTGGRAVFVGIARTRDVDRYLGDVARSTMHDPWDTTDRRSTFAPGGAPTTPPGSTGMWVTSSTGSDVQTLRWEPRTGDWTLVVMNADGNAPVAAEVTMSAELPVLDSLTLALVVGGLVIVTAAGVALVLAVPR